MKKKVGILTFHYSNNYGGVLQCYALYKTLINLGYDAEVINYIPLSYKNSIIRNLGMKDSKQINFKDILNKISVKLKYSNIITEKFNQFREEKIKLSKIVNENTINEILNNYNAIIVGSDQIWNPSERSKKEYFLNFDNEFKGKKISYAADSTVGEINSNVIENVRNSLKKFDFITVRNKHTFDFVNNAINKSPNIVADPTILYDFCNDVLNTNAEEKYILTYILGDEIRGGHRKAIEKIKNIYGDIPVYSIAIPTMKLQKINFANKIYYDLSPIEWIMMIKNATFVYTDSYHGCLFSLKYNKPFLAYYTEELRSTRFKDLGERYNVKSYIVTNTNEINDKTYLEKNIDFTDINKKIYNHRKESLEILEKMLK